MEKAAHFFYRSAKGIKKALLVMKIATIMLLLALQVSAESFAQKTITLNVKNVALSDVFTQIEKQTDYRFFYSNDDVYADLKVSVEVNNEKLESVLEKLLTPNNLMYIRKNYKIIVKNIIPDDPKANTEIISSAKRKTSADKIITGIVTDENNVPMAGVSIVLKGSRTGSSTNASGKFSINVPDEKAVLIFSYTGYADQEVVVGNQSNLTVALKHTEKSLKDVVVIAYGKQKKTTLTAAVEMVDKKVIENRPVKSVAEMLEGTVPGLNINVTSGAPDATPNLNIRGFTGLNQSRPPLILVDGVEQDINSINANDIDNISILKDAAATAIYGSRAPFGAILITTKKGRKGAPLRVTYSSTVQVNKPFKLPHTQNALDFALEANRGFYNEGQGAQWPQATLDNIKLFMEGKGPSNTVQANGTWGEHFAAHSNTDYVGEAFKKYSLNSTQNLAVSGGSENISYYLGVGWNGTNGVYNSEYDKFNRYNATFNVDANVKPWMNIGLNTRYAKIKTVRPNYRGSTSSTSGDGADGSFWTEVSYFPNIPIRNPDGEYHRLSAFPVLDGLHGLINSDADDLWFLPSITLTPVRGLKISGQYSFNINSDEDQATTRLVTIKQPNGTVANSARNPGANSVGRGNSKRQYYQFDVNAEYTKRFNNHNLVVIAGMQEEYNRFRRMFASRNDLYSVNFPVLGNAYGTIFSINENYYEWSTRGYYGRANYNYREKYLLEISGRYAATSRFHPDIRWSLQPSVSAGYNVHKEEFWLFKNWFSKFKLTGSWGRSDNPLLDINQNGGIFDLVDLYTYLPVYTTGTTGALLDNGQKQPFVAPPSPIREDRTWEKPKTKGLGVEAGFFRNRLEVDYNWYQRTTSDALGTAERLPRVYGAAVPVANNAVTETRGWELSIKWGDKFLRSSKNPLSYGVRFIMSDYIGYVVKYGPGNPAGLTNGTWTPGEVFGRLFGYKVQGIAQNQDNLAAWIPNANGTYYYPGDLFYQDLDGDGQISGGVGGTWFNRGDLVLLGYTYPRYRYGMTFDASWKNFAISAVLDGVGKEVMYNSNDRVFGHAASTDWSSRTAYSLHQDLGYWSVNNTDAFFPRVYRSVSRVSINRTNDRYLINLAHLRVKNINLGYSLPDRVVKKLHIQSARINTSVENLGFVYYKSWLDIDPTLLRRGVGGYPTSRTMSLGLNVTF